MTRATMKSRLAKRLNDTAGDFYSDVDKNDLLNDGLHMVQKEVMKINPLAFVYIDKVNIVASDGGYVPKPQGFWYEMEVGYKDTTAVGSYRALQPLPYHLARNSSTGGGIRYSHFGRYFYISPIPAADITDGLQLLWVPTLSMAADTDVPDLHIALHHAVVVRAQIIAMGDTKDSTADAWNEYGKLVDDLPSYYQQSANEPDKFMLEGLGKSY